MVSKKVLIPFVPSLRCRRPRRYKILPSCRKDNDEKASSSGMAASTGRRVRRLKVILLWGRDWRQSVLQISI